MKVLCRSLYRGLADLLDGSDRADRLYLLRACEAAIRRIVLDDNPAAYPARSLFRETRHLFGVSEQARALAVIEAHVVAAQGYAERTADQRTRRCGAFSRKGAPCRREALRSSRFCPSHAHLQEPELPEALAQELGAGAGREEAYA